jgi:hypothetical protein
MSRARDLANLADEATGLATDSEVSAAIAGIDLTNVTRIVPVDSNISVPGAPTSVSGTVANASSAVSFVAPTDNGGSTILSYTVISSPGNIKKSGSSSPITITGLTNNTAYTFTVKAHNIAGSSVASSASGSVTPLPPISVDYLVVAGGASGGLGNDAGSYGAGGGAGGMRCTVTATGGGGSLETALGLDRSTNYTVTVGAGGAGQTSLGIAGNNGINSVFATITSTAGGGGAGGSTSQNGKTGGSGGGGGGNNGTAGAGTANQGYAGGAFPDSGYAAGGGGAGAIGSSSQANNRPGGAGVATSITGSSVTYATGGNGGVVSPVSGTANTGDGGGGKTLSGTSGAGGSGVVILRWLTADGSITVGAGLTADATGTDGSYSYKRFTAGTGNVSFA